MKRSLLRLQDGGGPLTLGPFHPDFWRAMSQGVRGTAAPMVQEVQQFNEDYPAVGQVAQLAVQPLNTAVGVYDAGKALLNNDPVGAAGSALGAVPVLGRFANRSVLAGTQQAIKDVQKARYMGVSPFTPSIAGTTAGRVAPDTGALIQANELGDASYKTTKKLREGVR